MGKKIIVLCCSPNKEGNTNTVAGWFAEGVREAGAEVELVDVAHMKYKVNGCIACMGCQKSDQYRCVIDDEATPVLARLPEYDLCVFATPVYMMGPTAQLKVFGDRMFSLFKFDAAGKFTHPFKNGSKMALITTCGGGTYDSGIKLLEKTFKMIAQFGGGKLASLLVTGSGESGAIKTNEKVRAKALAFGRKAGKQ